MDIVLIPGLWLDGSTWELVSPLEAFGHHAVPLTLPGQGDGASGATLDDQVAAVVAAVDALAGRPLVVGHSAAATLAGPRPMPARTKSPRWPWSAASAC